MMKKLTLAIILGAGVVQAHLALAQGMIVQNPNSRPQQITQPGAQVTTQIVPQGEPVVDPAAQPQPTTTHPPDAIYEGDECIACGQG
jgi:hypothetical protein